MGHRSHGRYNCGHANTGEKTGGARMSGHSKWATIKRKKAKVDQQRGKVFTKLGRELIVATRQGGPNPDGNVRLRIAIEKARDNNMPLDHIQRAIAKASGELEGVAYEEVLYEGYGPGGVAVLVEATTDNRKRSAAEMRFLFSRNGGSLGEAGCVGWLFDKKGLIVVEREGLATDEDALILAALDAGAEDVRDEGDSFAILTAQGDLEAVKSSLGRLNIPVAHSELTRVARSTVQVGGEDLATLHRLLELLEDHDDAQAVYANHEEQGEAGQGRIGTP
jgi:YebC/PmpR family DNA-binding regulatory protein